MPARRSRSTPPGNAYVTGFTQSPDFPTTAGAFDRTGSASNNLDVFVTKLNPAGTALVYSTFLGGSELRLGPRDRRRLRRQRVRDRPDEVADFPTTGGAFDRTFNVDNCPRCGIDQYDAFVTKLNPTGSGARLLDVPRRHAARRRVRDRARRRAQRLRHRRDRRRATSRRPPARSTARRRRLRRLRHQAQRDRLRARLLDAARRRRTTSCPRASRSTRAATRSSAARTRSTDFPTTPGAFDTTQNGGAFDERFDLFVTKLNAAGSGLVYSTFVGGSKSDFGERLRARRGRQHLPGRRHAVARLPDHAGRVRHDVHGRARRSRSSSTRPARALVYSTFLGDGAARSAVAPDASGNVWLAGASGAGAADHGRRLRPVLQRRRRRRLRRAAERDRLGARLRELPRRLRSPRPATTSRSTRPATSTSPATRSRRTSRPRRARSTARSAGDPTIFWGDAFVAKISAGGTRAGPDADRHDRAAAPRTADANGHRDRAAPQLPAPTQLSPAARRALRARRDRHVRLERRVRRADVHDPDRRLAVVLRAAHPRRRRSTASQYTATGLPTTRMWWRVRANDGAWSAARRFELKN